MEHYTTTVLGAGSVGLGIAASLAQAGQSLTLLTRPASVPTLRGQSITVSGMHGDHHIPAGMISIEDATAPSDAARSCDMLVVTTKVYDIQAALVPFAAAGPRPRAVLAIQNGLGASEAIRAVLGPDTPVYASSVMIGLERLAFNHVAVKAAAGPIATGPLLGDDAWPIEAFVASAQGGFLPVSYDASIGTTVLFKLLFKTCLNPTGALTGLTYGELVTNEHTSRLIELIAGETLSILDAESHYRPAATGAAYLADILGPAVLARS